MVQDKVSGEVLCGESVCRLCDFIRLVRIPFRPQYLFAEIGEISLYRDIVNPRLEFGLKPEFVRCVDE